ncbi:MAG: hypothetical protein CVT79_05185 [Alphaproteobacteria bacterium HGW-Alphaproteobacteria-18]|nr:MAG: hypothetical protein CVT79_05185 [Alphaproteobacteria bacterium HGW-Alphaproteobacteria-18]
MGNLDDYNDRLRKQNLGMPVGPPTNAAQMAADMAADAQRRALAPRRTGGASYSNSTDHSVGDLFKVLAISLPICVVGIAVLNIFSGDLGFLGWIAALAGGTFAIGSMGILVKRALVWVLSQIVIGIAITLGAIGRLITRPFRRR